MRGILESRAAIEDLVHRYAYNIRNGLGAECGALFTDDATFEVREADPLNPADARSRSRLAGREAIEDYVARSAGGDMRVCPLINNLLIEVDGDGARSSCIMTTRTWPPGHDLIGEYRDTYRYESGWRFSSRIYTIFRASAG